MLLNRKVGDQYRDNGWLESQAQTFGIVIPGEGSLCKASIAATAEDCLLM